MSGFLGGKYDMYMIYFLYAYIYIYMYVCIFYVLGIHSATSLSAPGRQWKPGTR